VVNVFGGVDLDLRGPTVGGPELTLTVISIFGGSDIVPDGVEVDMSGFALFGGNDADLKGPPPPPGAPVVRVRACSLFGGTDVKRRPG
jgi:hypothetical protein